MKSFWNLLDKSFQGIYMIIFSNVHPVSAWKHAGGSGWEIPPFALREQISSKVRDGFFQDGSDPTGGEFPPKQLDFFVRSLMKNT